MRCNVCDSVLEKVLYDSQSTKSLTSLCTLYEGVVLVYFCTQCAHIQSEEIENIDGYYDKDYDILINSEDEDQVYEVVNNYTIYRTSHQVKTLVSKVPVHQGTKILDYGCAKSSTMRELLNAYKDVSPYLFDVSERYVPFWSKFLSRDNWATYEIPISWDNQFDVMTSFFSLEHMAKPQEALHNASRVLKVGGYLYGVVPNVFTNPADLIVVDHINHFTPISLRFLLQNSGFDVI
ncbi:MAG: methyltransferase domain-containing protein, partial [Methylomarinum sp.]|nr:methyltransferase domain-containing protein [Methylomarinum sp.]